MTTAYLPKPTLSSNLVVMSVDTSRLTLVTTQRLVLGSGQRIRLYNVNTMSRLILTGNG